MCRARRYRVHTTRESRVCALVAAVCERRRAIALNLRENSGTDIHSRARVPPAKRRLIFIKNLNLRDDPDSTARALQRRCLLSALYLSCVSCCFHSRRKIILPLVPITDVSPERPRKIAPTGTFALTNSARIRRGFISHGDENPLSFPFLFLRLTSRSRVLYVRF